MISEAVADRVVVFIEILRCCAGNTRRERFAAAGFPAASPRHSFYQRNRREKPMAFRAVSVILRQPGHEHRGRSKKRDLPLVSNPGRGTHGEDAAYPDRK